MEENRILKEMICNEVETLLKNRMFYRYTVDNGRYMAIFDIFKEENILTIAVDEDTVYGGFEVFIDATGYNGWYEVRVCDEGDIGDVVNGVKDAIMECVNNHLMCF